MTLRKPRLRWAHLPLTIAVLAGFILGTLGVRPVARAMEIMGITACALKGNGSCIGGSNSTDGYGVTGKSVNGSGVYGLTKSKSGYVAGVYGSDIADGPHNSGMIANSINGTGLRAGSSNGIGLEAATNGLKNSGIPAIHAMALLGGDLFDGDGAQNSTFKIDTYGNIYTQGQLFSGGSCSAGCMRTMRERSYGTTASVPTIEDTGESQTRNGFVSIRLDPAFANAIDARKGYVVLVTPEGDTRGLFVAQRTASGFAVRETTNGRGDVPFAYRIVAHPFGVNQPRLPMVDVRPLGKR